MMDKLRPYLASNDEYRLTLDLCGLTEEVRIPVSFVTGCLVPLMDWLQQNEPEDRVIVGIGGPPGIGKSLLCALIEFCWGKDECLAVVSMDAYHFNNEKLDEMGLRARKGLLETIDGQSLLSDLTKLREDRLDDVKLPKYDRKMHQPIADAVSISKRVRVVLMEGIHLFDARDPTWKSIRTCFDKWILLRPDSTAGSLCRSRVIQRKVKNQVAEHDAARHYEDVDQLNFDTIMSDMGRCLQESGRCEEIAEVGIDADGNVQHLLFHEKPETISLEDMIQRDDPAKILTIGPNPALQKTLVFNKGWEKDTVNRADKLGVSVGGKGQQFARAASQFVANENMKHVRVLLFQFLGGSNGDKVSQLINDDEAKPGTIVQRTVKVCGETRTCITLVEGQSSDEATELIEPSEAISEREVNELLQRLRDDLANLSPENDRAAITFNGTMPPGADTLYHDIVCELEGKESRPVVFLDGFKGLSTLLLENVNILKVNATELKALAGKSTVQEAAFSMLATFSENLQHICVTDGGKMGYVFSRSLPPKSFVEYLIPSIPMEEFANPIGAGDTVGAVTLLSFLNGTDITKAFALGLSAGSASCLEIKGACFTKQSQQDLFKRIRMAKVKTVTPSS